jgi:hypothetical protein
MQSPVRQPVKVGKDVSRFVRKLAAENLVVADDIEVETDLSLWREMGVSVLARGNDQNQDSPPYAIVYRT